jgi:hypothetical protein
MSQFDWGTMDPYVVDGVELADDLNQWRDALLSLHRGSARPPYVVPGQLWINDSAGANAWVLQWYVSPTVGDVALFTLNTTTGAITISASAGGQFAAAVLLAQAAANPQVQWNATGNPIDVKNWRMTVNGVGALVLSSYSDAGVLQNSITFNRNGSIASTPVPVPVARFEVTSNWTWGLTTGLPVPFDKTIFNDGAGTFSATAGWNGGHLWTPGAGTWRISVQLGEFAQNGQSAASMLLLKNPTGGMTGGGFIGGWSGYLWQSINTIVGFTCDAKLLATDGLQLQLAIATGSGFAGLGGGYTFLSGTRINP